MVDLISPIILFIVYTIVLVFRNKIIDFPKTELFRKELRGLYECITPSLKNPILSIILPIFTIVFVWYLFIIFNIVKFHPVISPFFFFVSTVFSPISEELIARGVMFGFGFVTLPKIYQLNEKNAYIMLVIGVVFTNLMFIMLHDQINIVRISVSILAMMFYLINNKNLLSPILVHAVSNLIANFYFL